MWINVKFCHICEYGDIDMVKFYLENESDKINLNEG